MDFYFDIGMAVILRVIKDRRSVQKYFDALGKLYEKLQALEESDQRFADVMKERLGE